MGEIADELREMAQNGYDFFEEMSPIEKVGRDNPNWKWTDRYGRTQSFMEMDGFHLWNIKVFIQRSGKRGLMNRLPYIEKALKSKNYGVGEYRKDCEQLREEGSAL